MDHMPLEDLLEKSNNDSHELHMLIREEFVKFIIEKEQALETEIASILESGFKIKQFVLAFTFYATLCSVTIVVIQPWIMS